MVNQESLVGRLSWTAICVTTCASCSGQLGRSHYRRRTTLQQPQRRRKYSTASSIDYDSLDV